MILALLLSCMICPEASECGAPAADRQRTTAVIVSGISKDPNDQAAGNEAVSGLREHLLKRMNVDAQRLIVLAADAAPASSLQSTASQVSQAMETFASTVRPNDRFIFYYVGQANAAGGELRFNLPGPDMTQKELAGRLSRIKAGAQLIVLDCPCSALAAKTLTGANRIVVCASAATQVYGTRFSPHFVHALAQPQTDANNDGKVSLLEAFTETAKEIEQWYRQKGILPTETPCLEDDGDGTPSERPWKYQTEGGDGLKASTFLLAEGR
jgi:hypothetical protein